MGPEWVDCCGQVGGRTSEYWMVVMVVVVVTRNLKINFSLKQWISIDMLVMHSYNNLVSLVKQCDVPHGDFGSVQLRTMPVQEPDR